MARRATLAGPLPEGFLYIAQFLSPEEHDELLRNIELLPFEAFEFHGYRARRRIVEYGWEYDFGSRQATATKAIPAWLLPVRQRAAAAAGITAESLVETIVTEYPPGAPIGWHRDVPQFDLVIGISLGSPCRMRFKPFRREGKPVSVVLEPGSLYLLRGAVRWEFQHSIPAVERLRYSITFRTLRAGARPRAA